MKSSTAAALAVPLLLIVGPSVTMAEILDGELEVFGMTCRFCGYGIEEEAPARSRRGRSDDLSG